MPEELSYDTARLEEVHSADGTLALALLKDTPAQIAILDERGVICGVNGAWLRAARDLLGEDASRTCAGADYLAVCARSEAAGDATASEVRKGLEEILGGGSSFFTLEYICSTPGGERWWLLYAAPLSESGAVVAHIDITSRRLEEIEVAKREEWQRLILSNTSYLISTHTLSGAFVFVSGACRRLLGYEPEDMMGREILDFVHPDDHALAQQARLQLEEGSENVNFTCRLRRKDGRYIWAETKARPAGAIGRLLGYCVAVTRDVTSHKEAEEQQARLRRALEKAAFEWRSTFDAIGTPILLLGIDGRIQKVNRAAKELLGSEYREIIGYSINEVGSGPPWGAVAALAGRVLESFTAQVCEAADERRAQTWEIEASISVGTEKNEAKAILQIRDITQTARLQESLRRSETMAALGAVVGGVAHEVRNPLFGMSAVLDAFESRFGDRPEHQPYLPLLRAELNRMTDLMKALLDYGKPTRFEMVPGDPARPLEQALERCAPLAERRGVALSVEGKAAPALVYYDLDRLSQAFQNVIENALQHSPEGGRVELRWTERMFEGESWVRLSVRDAGPGFQATDLPRATEPFFSRRSGGTGLGLSIVSRMIEGHGGKLHVANHPEGGALVEMELPCHRSMEVS
ncbi:MAG TPA: PAS domain S-box protein [Thermoanaerobaculia bacterium]